MYANEKEADKMRRMREVEVKKVQEFKYVGSAGQSNGECGKEVNCRLQTRWSGWRRVSGPICDRLAARVKGKVYQMVVGPAFVYGFGHSTDLETGKSWTWQKMLRCSLGVTRMDRIKNEHIRGTARDRHLGDKVREARLRWLGYIKGQRIYW